MATTKLSTREKYIQGRLRKKYGWSIRNYHRKRFIRNSTVLDILTDFGISNILELEIFDERLRDSILYDSPDESIVIRHREYGILKTIACLDFKELELLYLAAKERRNSIAAHMSEVK